MEGLIVESLNIERSGKKIVKDLSFSISSGELIHLGGANGSGKSTLALTLMGHPSCQVKSGAVRFFDQDILVLKPHERAKLGIFLAHQEPPALAGVSMATAFRAMVEATSTQSVTTAEYYDRLRSTLARVGLAEEFMDRGLHEGFSGGEKKRGELAALLMLKPRLAILDEIDAGMDEVARSLTKGIIEELRAEGTSFLVISHNQEFALSLSPTGQIELEG